MASKKFLIFQHIKAEHPGIFRSFLNENRIESVTVELDEGDPIPSLDGFDALWVMGGPMDVWQKEQFPWLVDEVEAIRLAVVDRKLPYLGLCLGHQLLAEALGGTVAPAETPEIGVMDVSLTAAGTDSAFLSDIQESAKCLQWHSAEVKDVPAPAIRLMESSACHWQAMSYATHALGLQFHVELEAETVGNWGEIPEYAAALENALGAGALSDLNSAAQTHMAAMNATAQQIYTNWMRCVFP